MCQVHKGEGQLSLEAFTGLWRCEESGNAQLPLTGVVPDLHQAVVLRGRDTIM